MMNKGGEQLRAEMQALNEAKGIMDLEHIKLVSRNTDMMARLERAVSNRICNVDVLLTVIAEKSIGRA
jgi:hypothetical protein